MNIVAAQADFIPAGVHYGKPCFFISVKDSEDAGTISFDDVVNKVKESKIKLVCIAGSIKDCPEIPDLGSGLSSIGLSVIIRTKAEESIEPLRSIRNLSFILVVESIPNENDNTVSVQSLSLLKEQDELQISIGSEKEYASAMSYLRTKVVTRPTVSFFLGDIRDSGVQSIEESLLEDSKSLIFPVRLF